MTYIYIHFLINGIEAGSIKILKGTKGENGSFWHIVS